MPTAAKRKKTEPAAEVRRFGMHPKLLLDVIKRQADPLVIARQCVDEAIFDREAERLEIAVHETSQSGEENVLEWYADLEDPGGEGRDGKALLEVFLNRLSEYGLPLLVVEVPESELEYWEAHKLNTHFQFESTPDE